MKKLRLGLVLSAAVVGLTLLGSYIAAPSAIVNAASEAAAAWSTAGNNLNKDSFLGSINNKAVIIKTNNTEKMRITPKGLVGIGTTKPVAKLHVLSVGDERAPRLESSGATSFGAGWDFYLGSTGKGYVGVPGSAAPIAPGEMLLYGGSGSRTSIWGGGNRSITIATNGKVGIGTTSPKEAVDIGSGRLILSDPTGLGDVEFTEAADLIGWGTTATPDPGFRAFGVDVGTGLTNVFLVNNDGTTKIGGLKGTTTTQACLTADLTFAGCSSAAEYVPSIAGAAGFPETADLVSIATDVKNPYGDEHGPFAVQKSATACDSNLLGYIVNPTSGANGVKLNEHYMPLAIFGYFPAKVTLENGAIKRGDPITSSLKAGYGMKATGACKVIGYALEDATAEGTIQVFANHGDNAAAQVATLQQQNDALKQELKTVETRLAALELATTANGSMAAAVR